MNNTTGHAHDATAWLQLARRLQKQQLQQLSQLGELASQLSALVHMLQCERGASNIYLCSGGLLYTAECRAGGALVDERLALFYASLERARAVAGSALCWRIARAVDELAQLPALRAQIGRRQIAAEAATEQFSRVIRHLLNIAPQLNDSIDDPPVAGRMVALYSFMQGKELVGQERALGALGFTRGEFSDSLRQQLVDRIDGQSPASTAFRRWAARRPSSCSEPSATPVWILNSCGGSPVPASRLPTAGKRRCAGLACKPNGLSNCVKWKSN